MLAGLIFATEDADDRPGVLAATLPFGGATLIEFQARLLIAAGASQIALVVARMTPELLGAINRIGRRGVPVDAVRSAVEVSAKLHPLASVLVVADGVTTTADIVASLAREGGDALLVTDDTGGRYERVGVATAWAGLARLEPLRIAEVAALPRDYDFQSTLLRVAAQAGAEQVRLAPGSAHAIERDSRTLATRGRAILSTLLARPTRWADRFVLAACARLALPLLIGRALPVSGVLGAGAITALAGLAAIRSDRLASGLVLAVLAAILFHTGAALAQLRDDRNAGRSGRIAINVTPMLFTILVAQGDRVGWIAAGAGILIAALVERAGDVRIRRRWWASPTAYLIVLLPFAAFGRPVAGLVVAGLYATATLAAAIEALREKP